MVGSGVLSVTTFNVLCSRQSTRFRSPDIGQSQWPCEISTYAGSKKWCKVRLDRSDTPFRTQTGM